LLDQSIKAFRYWADEHSPMINNRRPRLLFGTIFLAITVLILLLRSWLDRQGIDSRVMLSGNAILFLATMLSFYLFRKSYQKSNVQYILRMVYGGIFTKLAICVLAAFAYIIIARSAVDKIALFTCFGFYFIYTFTEVKLLIQLSKEQKNA
jgi:hypothetical protein